MDVQKFRNFVITEFVKSGIHCIFKYRLMDISGIRTDAQTSFILYNTNRMNCAVY